MAAPHLRLFHLTDLHYGPRPVGLDERLERVRSALGVDDRVPDNIDHALATHDRRALRAVLRSVVDEAEGLRDDAPAYVVFTGDLSHWGDRRSIRTALRLLRSTTRRARLPPPVVLYGNHDVWPGRPGLDGLPMFATEAELGRKRSALLDEELDGRTTQIDAIVADAGSRRVRVHALDTVQHEPGPNLVARGHVERDRYWEDPPGPDPLARLEALDPDDVHVVLTHHPVHDPERPEPPTLLSPFVLGNRESVARAARRARVFLSGHTHRVSPAELPRTVETATRPLTAGQLQLIGPSAAQRTTSHAFAPGWQLVELTVAGTTLRVRRRLHRRVAGGAIERVADEVTEVALESHVASDSSNRAAHGGQTRRAPGSADCDT